MIVGWNDLATVKPELAVQLVDPSIAETVTRGSNKSVLWFCMGTDEAPHPRHEWPATVANRWLNGSGCPACVGQAVVVGWNDLATVSPELAAQLVDPSVAKAVTRSSNKSVLWFCEGTSEAPHPRFEWSAQVAHRSRGHGCAACSGHAVIAGWNDLATVKPGLAAQLVDPSLAETVTRGSMTSALWSCDGTSEAPHPHYEWAATVANRSKGNGCPACAGRAVIVGWNDLATVNPELAAQLVDPSIAETVTRSAGKSVLWFCEGTSDLPHPRREWTATVNNRASGFDCAACAGKAVIAGWNDLATLEPELAAQLVDPSIATVVTRSSNKSVLWFCEGTTEAPHRWRQWSASVGARSGGKGCAVCAPHGFDPSKPGWLYFLRHDEWDMQQIGITNDPDERVGRHKRHGWQLLEIRKFDDGVLCATTERAALAALRLRGAQVGRSSDPTEIKFDGYTEAWPILSLELVGLQQLLEWVRKDEWASAERPPLIDERGPQRSDG